MSKKKTAAASPDEDPKEQSLTVGKGFSLTPTNLDQAIKLAELIANSDLAPKDFKGKAGNCLIAMQMGMEVGLAPMQAIQNIAVINGRPTLWGDAALGLVLASSVCEYVKESWDEKTQTWTCSGKRKGKEEGVYTFSLADAQKAGLTKKEGPWANYPKRMIQMRARAFCLRDNFADVLKGLAIREEVEDYVETTSEPVAPIAMPKPKVQEEQPVYDGSAVLLPGEYSFFVKKMNELGADFDEVKRFTKDKFGTEDLSKLTKDQAKQVIATWNPDPPEAA